MLKKHRKRKVKGKRKVKRKMKIKRRRRKTGEIAGEEVREREG